MNSLEKGSKSFTIKLSMNEFGTEKSSLKIDDGAKISTRRLFSFIKVSASGDTEYDLQKYVSSSSTVEIVLSYEGITQFEVDSPSRIETNNLKGWYDEDIIRDIVKTNKKDATGCSLPDGVADELFGEGKEFARIKTFILCREPTITMNFTATDETQFSEDFKGTTTLSVSVLGMARFSSSASYSWTKSGGSGKLTSFKVVLSAPPPSSGSDPFKRVAYVLGGVPVYPPNK